MSTDLALDLPSGSLTGKTWGRPDAPLVVCLPGFSQDERCYDVIGEPLGELHVLVRTHDSAAGKR